jgi:hypothetical protein
MTDRPLDHWRERMVDALYGELSDAERTELETELARDPNLRRDLEELTEARAALRRLLESTEGAEQEPAAVAWGTRPGWPEPGRRSPWRTVLAAGIGFAAAASLFVGLLFAGLRVDRTRAGVLVHLDRSPIPVAVATVSPDLDPYPTRDELAVIAELLATSTAHRLDQLERRQAVVQAEVAQTLYDALAVAQQRQYHDLRNRIDLAVYRPADLQLPGRSTQHPQPWNE